MIPYGKQDINEYDIQEVIEVLKSDFLTTGPKVPEFESILASYSGTKYAFAHNSATSALHTSCLALGLEEGDWLWTSPITFVASSNAGLYCGAKVDFVDIDPKTFNICPLELEKKLIASKSSGTLPKILIPVHMGGLSCDMEKIHSLCKAYGIKIIEDASHAVGGKYLKQPVGTCQFSDVCIYSFHPVKIVTTGEGGAALTNDKNIAERIELFRSHGITRKQEKMKGESHGPWYYQQILLGYNYRMTDIQAALGISQMKRINQFVSRRNEIAERYDLLLKNLPLELPFKTVDSISSFHLYIIRLNLKKINLSHLEVFDGMRNAGIGVNLHYIPVHLQPFYQSLGFSKGDFPKSEAYYAEAISLPIYTKLTDSQQDTVIETLTNLLVEK